MQTKQVASESAAHVAAYLAPEPRRIILTVTQFSERNPAFSESALRNLIFKAEPRQSSKGVISGNGLLKAGAIVRLGRKVMLDEVKFFGWVESQQGGGK